MIEAIIETHFKLDKPVDLYRNLHNHLMEFGINPDLLLGFLSTPGYLRLEDLNLDKPGTYKKVIEFLNNIKIKYGTYLRQYATASKEPFLLNTVEINVNNGETLHSLKIGRADGTTLEGMFKPATLIPIMGALIGALKKAMEVGIFNLDRNAVDFYLSNSADLNQFLTNLISEETSNGKSDALV